MQASETYVWFFLKNPESVSLNIKFFTFPRCEHPKINMQIK